MRALAILAAGGSTRLGQDKVLADLGGQPVLAWSLAAGAAAGVFDEIVVVAPGPAREAIESAIAAQGRRARVVTGGVTRTASSWCALDALPDAGVIAIHDAARPFAPPSLFATCVEVAEQDGSAVAGLPVADTVRRADASGVVLGEVPRDALWSVQTPQAFRRELLARAREAARDRSFTDDAAALVAAGLPVRMIAGDRRNVKITTLEDLAYARELVEKGLAAIAATAL